METYFFFFVEDWNTIEEKIQLYVRYPTPKYMLYLMKYSTLFFGVSLGLIALYL